jgi:hypothetical protein
MVVDWRLPQDTTRILRWESGASTRVIRAKRNINPEFYPNSTHAEDRVRLRWAATITGRTGKNVVNLMCTKQRCQFRRGYENAAGDGKPRKRPPCCLCENRQLVMVFVSQIPRLLHRQWMVMPPTQTSKDITNPSAKSTRRFPANSIKPPLKAIETPTAQGA